MAEKFKVTLELSDLLMVDTNNRMDTAKGILFSDASVKEKERSFRELVEGLKFGSTLEKKVFEKEIENVVEGRASKPMGALKEAGQNGYDSYNGMKEYEGKLRKVEFKASQLGRSVTLKVRDYGKGMEPGTVISDLLVPYNSDKPPGEGYLGQHGTGWYTLLYLSPDVTVTTGKGGYVTEAHVHYSKGKAMVDLTISEGKFQGTEVVAVIHPGLTDLKGVEASLHKYLGLVSKDKAEITFNGKPVNVRGREYDLGAAESVEHNHAVGDITVYFDKHPENIETPVVFTQNGLFVKDGNCLVSKESAKNDATNLALYLIMETLLEKKIGFWVDLPPNIDLEEGRNDIASKDVKVAENAVYCAFQKCLLEFLNDDFMRSKMDTQLADIVEEILKGELKPVASRYAPKDGGQVGGTRVYGTDHFHEGKLAITPEEEAISAEQLSTLGGLGGLAKDLLHNQYLKAIRKSEGKDYHVKVSIMDIVRAWEAGKLFKLHEDGTAVGEDGLHINENDILVSRVVSHLQRYGLSGPKEETSFRYEPRRSSYREEFLINHTPLEAIQKINETQGVGYEYTALLEVIQYVDNLVTRAHYGSEYKGQLSPMRIHSHEAGHVAHTDYDGISFNLNSWATSTVIQAIREKRLDPKLLMGLVDICIHEKTHCVVGRYDTSGVHEEKFKETKKMLRREFQQYCMGNKIDYEAEINAIVGQYDYSRIVKRSELGPLIEEAGAAS